MRLTLLRPSWIRVLRFVLVATLAGSVNGLNGYEPYPLERTQARVRVYLDNARVSPTGLKREDYLAGAWGIVTHFRAFQTSDGRIIDPYAHREFSLATACYAWAAASLVASGHQLSLRESAVAALDISLGRLAGLDAETPMDAFAVFPVMFAFEHLLPQVGEERQKRWKALLNAIPLNTVLTSPLDPNPTLPLPSFEGALVGAYMRQELGFQRTEEMDAELGRRLNRFDAFGLYDREGVSDLCARALFSVLLARGYEKGGFSPQFEDMLMRSAYTSMLLQSPIGEGPTFDAGGAHQWVEAAMCVLYEVWASKRRAADPVGAGAFKRAAHLSLRSLQRWVRPSRDLWAAKNRFDASLGYGVPKGTSHSQENLLVACFLATAWYCANDRINEGACPAEVGGFVVSLEKWRQLCVNASGTYLLLDTGSGASGQYPGLMRLHHRGLEALTGAAVDTVKGVAVLPGVAWKRAGEWHSLAETPSRGITRAEVNIRREDTAQVRFSVRYELNDADLSSVVEDYSVSERAVRVTTDVEGRVDQIRVQVPVLTFNGYRFSELEKAEGKASVQMGLARQDLSVEWPVGVDLGLSSRRLSDARGAFAVIEGLVNRPRVVYSIRAAQVSEPGSQPSSAAPD